MAKSKLPQGGVFPFRPRQKSNWSLSPSERLNEILKRRDVKHLVRSMPVPDLYAFIRQLGLNDAVPVLALASGEQIQQMTDMEIWHRDRVTPLRMVHWLEVVLAGDPENITERVRNLDPELLQCLLTQHVRVYTIEDDMSVAKEQFLASLDLVRTPDDTFYLDLHGPDEITDFCRRLMHQLYIEDAPFARSLMFECLSQLTSNVEEEAYRIRQGRMEALGFIELYEALALFQPLPKNAPLYERHHNQGGSELQNTPLLPQTQANNQESFLGQALQLFGEEHPRDEIHRDFVMLANKISSAEEVSPADEEAIQGCLRLAYDYVGLGLEILSNGDVEDAVELLATVHCERLFKEANTQIMALAQTANKGYRRMVAPLGVPVELGPWPDELSKLQLQALGLKRPQLHVGIIEHGSVEQRHFKTVQELHAAQSNIRRAIISAQFMTQFMALGRLDPEALSNALPFGEQLSLTQLLLTALAQRIVGNDFKPQPLPEAQALRFIKAAREPLTDGAPGGLRVSLLNELKKAAASFGDSHGQERAVFLEGFIDTMNSEFTQHYGRLDLTASLQFQFIEGPLLIERPE